MSLANGELRPVERDTTQINDDLNDVNQHLTSICEATLALRGLPLASVLQGGMLSAAEIAAAVLANNEAREANNDNEC